MKVVTLIIGNSDDKLKQSEWADFCDAVHLSVCEWADKIHFYGASDTRGCWQYCGWVFEIDVEKSVSLVWRVKNIRRKFKQAAVAWIDGEAVLV